MSENEKTQIEETPSCVTIRKLRPDDDFLVVAELIYLTDEYIYPNWFDTEEDGYRVITEMISLDTMYFWDNVTVAVLPNGKIVGVLVCKDCPFVLNEDPIREAFKRAGVVCDERTHKIFLDYYDKMKDEREGLYLANIAVHPQYRKRGIAGDMIRAVIKDKPLAHLECVQENSGAWRLYLKLGFEVAFEYPGVFDVPCYKMIYRKKV